MRMQRLWLLSVLTVMALMAASSAVRAQSAPPYPPMQPPVQGWEVPANAGPIGAMPPGAMPPGAYGPAGYMPAGYPAAPVGYMPAPGMTAGPYGAMPTVPAAYMDYAAMDGYYGQPPMGEPGSGDFQFNLWRYLLPYAEGGICTQRWYDLQAEWMYLKRENVSRLVNFSSDGILGPVVLSSEDLAFDEASGFRASAALQLGPGNNLEVSYFGTFNWASAAQATSAFNELYSPFSDFGVNPFNGFADVDQAALHRIEYSSGFDSIELNFRCRWMGPNCKLQGSYLAGVRYFQLDEQFLFLAQAPANNGFTNYFCGTSNAMTGFQVGGDLWANVIPGLRVGGELKAGLYGNRAKQLTNIVASSIPDGITEKDHGDRAAFVAEAGVDFTWRISQNWTARAGYQFLYVDSVALALENFNSGPPFVQGARSITINDNGDVFYHGLTAGLEWLW